ncbi:MAG TPA: cadherin-like beta sandwich domain-containing protein [Spirochaetota bacterium]|nr:cadherin-like beta sandwich domain-containing protein [Spirochaetota bacterium]HSA14501.1 cadherin-like beta sandwich domain-containing protein [Spirochaetota bacterium]
MKKLLSYAALIVLMFAIAACDDGDNGEKPAGDGPVLQACLNALRVDPGELDPVFSSDTLSYEVSVDASFTAVTVTAVPDDGTRVSVNGNDVSADDYSAEVGLAGERTVITISASAEGLLTREYRITVVRAAQNPVRNWSFESYEIVGDTGIPLNWTVSTASGEFIATGNYAHDGSHSGIFTKLTGTIAGREVLSDAIAVDPSRNLTVSCGIYLPREDRNPGRAGAGIKIYYFTDRECLVPCENASDTKPRVTPAQEGVWEQVSFERVAADIPGDAACIRIALRACFIASAGGTDEDVIYFDGVSLSQPD